MALTLKLNSDWDICLDGAGRISTYEGPYSIAQHVANSVRLFTDDSIYEPERGIPHFIKTLGEEVSTAVVRSRIKQAALEVDGVEEAEVDIERDGRELGGVISIKTTEGVMVDVDI